MRRLEKKISKGVAVVKGFLSGQVEDQRTYKSDLEPSVWQANMIDIPKINF